MSEHAGTGAAARPALAEVAEAVGLQEGEPGVRNVLRAYAALAPASTRAVSRRSGLPVPIVAAVANELRARGLLTTDRPSQLTAAGRELAGPVPAAGAGDPGGEVPARYAGVVARLEELMEAGPAADPALDQSHCTADTKVRRVLYMVEAGALPAEALLLVGDDDLVAVAVALVGEELGRPLVARLAVVDVAADVLEHIARATESLGTGVEVAEHDLRHPLPPGLASRFDAAMTDTPYTAEGSRLFLSRAVAGLRPGPGRSIFFSYGPQGPDDMLEVQRGVLDLGLVVHDVARGFNRYVGSGILGGSGNLYHLLTTASTTAAADRYEGPLYTRDRRPAARAYRCRKCGARVLVGVGQQYEAIAALNAAGCPECGRGPFAPQQLAD